MTTIYLVRHGLTSQTGTKLTGWQEGVHLSPEGLEQADAAAAWLSRKKLAAVYSSPIDRTMETAAPIARTQGLKVRSRRALGEVQYGSWTGRNLATLARTRLWRTVQAFPSNARFPEGETLRETQARVLAEISSLVDSHPKASICVVSHADVIRLVSAHYLGVHIDLFQRIVIDPASITVIGVSDAGPRIFTLNSLPYEAKK